MHPSPPGLDGDVWFHDLTSTGQQHLRRALTARYGLAVGAEVCADAMAYAWEHRDRLAAMANPVGYLYRVGQTAARRHHRWQRHVDLPTETRDDGTTIEPGLANALGQLRHDERVAVVMVHAYGLGYAEVAELLDVPVSTIRNHVHRGLARLRRTLGDPS
jgi:RNA polymerase sigma factor (sigma-70 family)